MRRFLSLLLLLLALYPVVARSAPVLELAAQGVQTELTPYMVELEDPAGQWGIDEVRRRFAAGDFRPVAAKGFSKGYTRSTWWLAFQVRRASAGSGAPVAWLLDIASPSLDLVELFLPGATTPLQAGDSLPFSARPMPHVNFVFEMPGLTDETQTIFLRVHNVGTMLVPLFAWSPQTFVYANFQSYAAQAAYFGALLAMILYNALLWFSLRERVYGEYVCYAVFLGIGMGGVNGMSAQFFWPEIPWLVHYSYLVGFCLAGVFVTRFARSFLNTHATSLWLDRSLQWSGNALIASTLIVVVSYRISGIVSSVLLILCIVLPVWAGVYSALRRVPGSLLYLASWTFFLVFGLMLPLRNFGLVPNNFLTAHGVQFGSLAEMMLLSFALAARINQIRAEKARAQQSALEAQAQLVTALQNSEQALEARVAERTEQLEQANRRLAELSVTDSLTGIANRRHFDALVANEYRRMQRLEKPLALAMIDIEWFKNYNDHYGHQAGDACLVEVAATLMANIGRAGDLVARYGGEEFVFIAPATHAEAALAMAQRVCEAIAARRIAHAVSPWGHVTISIGVAAIVPTEEQDAEVLLKHADQALYQAKSTGRNRAVLFGEGYS